MVTFFDLVNRHGLFLLVGHVVGVGVEQGVGGMKDLAEEGAPREGEIEIKEA